MRARHAGLAPHGETRFRVWRSGVQKQPSMGGARRAIARTRPPLGPQGVARTAGPERPPPRSPPECSPLTGQLRAF